MGATPHSGCEPLAVESANHTLTFSPDIKLAVKVAESKLTLVGEVVATSIWFTVPAAPATIAGQKSKTESSVSDCCDSETWLTPVNRTSSTLRNKFLLDKLFFTLILSPFVAFRFDKSIVLNVAFNFIDKAQALNHVNIV